MTAAGMRACLRAQGYNWQALIFAYLPQTPGWNYRGWRMNFTTYRTLKLGELRCVSKYIIYNTLLSFGLNTSSYHDITMFGLHSLNLHHTLSIGLSIVLSHPLTSKSSSTFQHWTRHRIIPFSYSLNLHHKLTILFSPSSSLFLVAVSWTTILLPCILLLRS